MLRLDFGHTCDIYNNYCKMQLLVQTELPITNGHDQTQALTPCISYVSCCGLP